MYQTTDGRTDTIVAITALSTADAR